MNLLSKWPSYKTCRFDNLQNIVNVMIFQLILIFPSAHPLTVVPWYTFTKSLHDLLEPEKSLKTEMSKGSKDLKGEC